MKQALAFVFVAIAFSILGASVYHAATTSWKASDAQMADAMAQAFDPVPQAEAPKTNKLYAPQITADMVKRAKKIVLHLDGIHATTEVDTVRVLILTTVSGKEIQADIASLRLGFSGKPKNQSIAFDVTSEFSSIKDAGPSNFLVAFVVRGPNQRDPMDAHAFDVDQTYFELTDADGHPI